VCINTLDASISRLEKTLHPLAPTHASRMHGCMVEYFWPEEGAYRLITAEMHGINNLVHADLNYYQIGYR
jgi:hypothetical protein